jgi:hypothetical protein
MITVIADTLERMLVVIDLEARNPGLHSRSGIFYALI